MYFSWHRREEAIAWRGIKINYVMRENSGRSSVEERFHLIDSSRLELNHCLMFINNTNS